MVQRQPGSITEGRKMSKNAPKEHKHQHRKVACKIWNDAWFVRQTDNGKLLFLYLLTSQHTTSFGARKGTIKGLAAEMNWSTKKTKLAITDALLNQKVLLNVKEQVIYLPNFLTYNKPETPNVVRSWFTLLDTIPEGETKKIILKNTEGFIKGYGKGFQEAYAEIMRKALLNLELELELDTDLDSLSKIDRTDLAIDDTIKDGINEPENEDQNGQGSIENLNEESETDWRESLPNNLQAIITIWNELFIVIWGNDADQFGPMYAHKLNNWINSGPGQRVIDEYDSYGMHCFWNVIKRRFVDLQKGIEKPVSYLVIGLSSTTDPYLLKQTATEENDSNGDYKVQFSRGKS